mmetsp:Transcript_27840/g.33851  ORF Transcript_27840/g.33851 Transcript_27840/m.33851 type:complete len:366 (+) Transcript_27840:39-1136(+)
MSKSSLRCAPEETILTLPDDILRHVFVFLDPIEIIRSVSCSCRHFAALTSCDSFWRFKYDKCLATCFREPARSSLSRKQVQQCIVLCYKRKSSREWFMEGKMGERDVYSWPRSVLPSMEDAMESKSRGFRACLSSTTDRDQEEMIENVLVPSDEFSEDSWGQITSGNPRYVFHQSGDASNASDGIWIQQRWWSSAPSEQRSSDDTSEMLLFTTTAKAIITEVAIKPLTEPADYNFGMFWGRDRTVYSWPKISITIYSLPQRDDAPLLLQKPNSCVDFDVRSRDRRLDQRSVIDAILKDHSPTYESPVMTAKTTDGSWQYYKIPDAVVGNIVMFTLWGKTYEQYPNSGYYVCVERVAARGVPLLMM